MVGRLAIGILLAFAFYVLGTHPETHIVAKNSQPTANITEKMTTDPSPEVAPLTEPLTTSTPIVTEVEPLLETSVSLTKSNDQVAWERLIAEGFSRNQVAGIMGNLQQEHGFKTSDVRGGLGIAQWIGNRRANLMARADYLNINVQLDFLMDELRGNEHRAYKAIQSAVTVEQSTYAFQSKFERCGKCMYQQRLNYAYAILGRF